MTAADLIKELERLPPLARVTFPLFTTQGEPEEIGVCQYIPGRGRSPGTVHLSEWTPPDEFLQEMIQSIIESDYPGVEEVAFTDSLRRVALSIYRTGDLDRHWRALRRAAAAAGWSRGGDAQ